MESALAWSGGLRLRWWKSAEASGSVLDKRCGCELARAGAAAVRWTTKVGRQRQASGLGKNGRGVVRCLRCNAVQAAGNVERSIARLSELRRTPPLALEAQISAAGGSAGMHGSSQAASWCLSCRSSAVEGDSAALPEPRFPDWSGGCALTAWGCFDSRAARRREPRRLGLLGIGYWRSAG